MILSKFTDQDLIRLLGNFIENQKDLNAPYKAEILKQVKNRLEQLVNNEKKSKTTTICSNINTATKPQNQSIQNASEREIQTNISCS